MGIGPHAIKLTRIMNDARLLKPGFTVIELGSQDFAPTLEEAWDAIRAEFGYSEVTKMSSPADLYRAVGSGGYECIDLDGHRGAHVFDLNFSLSEKYDFTRQYDLVTNHGTTEHLFNQLVAFENIHGLTAPGGVMLHALPFQGYQNHGMFNYNPSLFLDLSIANGYEVFGLFLSVDDKLFAYDEEFLQRNRIAGTEDVLLMAVMKKGRSDAEFQWPYDGRYFAVHGRGDVSPLDSVGSTKRFGQSVFEFEGLDIERSAAEPEALVNCPYRFVTPLWGKNYVESFLRVTLPSQLSSGNLGAFGTDEAIYTIVTTESERHQLLRDPGFRELQRKMEVEFLTHAPLAGEHAYQRMTRCYNLALARSPVPHTCFFLTADDFYSDGLFRTAKSAIESGKRAVMVPTIRVVAESFHTEISVKQSKSLRPDATVEMMLRHEHPMTASCVINDGARRLHRLPAQTLYRLANGYVGRWNVMHPLAVRIAHRSAPIQATVDWNFPALHVQNADEIHIVRDSDEGVIASLTPYSYSQGEDYTRNGSRRRRIRNLKDWINIDWALNFHVYQMSQPIYYHTGVMGSEWKTGISALESIWRPYRRYIERHATLIPEAAKGSARDLLTRAVDVSGRAQMPALFRHGLRRLSRRWKSNAYAALVRRANG